MTPKERAAMQQALEALEFLYSCYANPEWISYKQQEDKIIKQTFHTITALREALAEQAEQEPVAWMNTNGAVNKLREAGWAMNAAPVRTKDLTDDELFLIADKVGFDGELMKLNHDRGTPSIAEHYARAVIAKDREKK